MPKYRLYTTSEVILTHEVEATSPEEALDNVNGAIAAARGNKWVGPCDLRASISVAGEWHRPDLSEVEEVS